MVVDPKWLAEKASGGAVQRDRHCVCGYNLKGLRIGNPCPECGRPIPLASGKSMHVAKFTDYPFEVLSRLSRGTTFMALGMWGMTVGYMFLWLTRGTRTMFFDVSTEFSLVIMLLVVAPASLMWWLGVIWVSGRDQAGADRAADKPTPSDLLAGRPAWYHWTMVASQSLWPVGASAALVGLFLEDAYPVAGGVLLLSAVGCAALASLSLTLVCLMMKELGYHALDDYASNRFHGLAFGIPIVACIFALFPAMHLVIGFSRAINFIGMMTLSLLLTPPAYLMLMALWSLGTTCRWARNNAVTAAEVEARFRERAGVRSSK